MPDAMWIECHACSEIFEAGRRSLGSRAPCPECGADARVEQSQLRQPPSRKYGGLHLRQAQYPTKPNPQAFFAFIIGLGIFMAVIFMAIVSGPSSQNERRAKQVTVISMSYRDYMLLQEGMTLEQVNKILRQEGVETARSGEFSYYQWSDGFWAGVTATFTHGKLTAKAQHGLR